MHTPTVADFTLKSGGTDLSPAQRSDVLAVTVLEDLSALSMFTVVLDNYDAEKRAVTWSDSDQFAIGAELRIGLGYLGAVSPAMTGEITSLEPRFTAEQASVLTVRGYDHGHRLARGRRSRTFTRLADSAIAEQIAREAGLGADVISSGAALDHVIQHNQSDLEFLRGRAQLIGYELFVRDKVLHFHPSRYNATDPAARIELTVGREIVEFTPRLRTAGQVGQVSVRGWDVAGKRAVSADATTVTPKAADTTGGPARVRQAFGPSTTTRLDAQVRSPAQAQQMAQGQLDARAAAYLEGELECAGTPLLRAGGTVGINGAGKTFSGAYYIVSAAHTLIGRTYRTRLELRRNAA